MTNRPMRLLLGIDLGTSYFKVGLFDENGGLRGLGRVRVASTSPESGRSELAIEVFWQLLREGLADALAQASARPSDIVAMSYSSQANTFVALDAADAPLTPIILWNDRRAVVEPADAAFSATPEFLGTVGIPGLVSESAVTKWRWLQRQRPEQWRRAERLLMLSDYFTWSLTGEWAGDASTAALLGIYDLHQRTWWPPALEHFDVAPRQLVSPQIPGTPCGRTHARANALLGVTAGLTFAVGALDHYAAAIGAGLDGLADASISTGTVLSAICLVNRVLPVDGCLHGPHVDGRRYCRLAFDPDGAGELEQFQQRHAPELSIEQLIARAIGPGADKARAPGNDPIGVHTRAILERIARAQRSLLHALQPERPFRAVAATGGGARSAAWLELTERIIGIPLVTPASAERACLGAAIFAAVAAGVFPSWEAAAREMVHPAGRFPGE